MTRSLPKEMEGEPKEIVNQLKEIRSQQKEEMVEVEPKERIVNQPKEEPSLNIYGTFSFQGRMGQFCLQQLWGWALVI
jgi:hypothetical protein